MMNPLRLLLIVAALLLCAAPAAARQMADSTLPDGVAAGDVTQTSVVLWARSTAPGALTMSLATDPTFATLVAVQTLTVTDPMLPVKTLFSGLTPATAYVYRVQDAAGTQAEGRFRTPPAAGTRAPLRFGVTGDWRGELAPYPSIANAAERDLDFFVQHGDTVYTDFPSPALGQMAFTVDEFRLKQAEGYGERYGLNTRAALRAATAVFTTMDDHEVRNDYAGGAVINSDPRFTGDGATLINDSALYEAGLQAFQEYNPLTDERYGDTGDPRTADEIKLYRYRTWGDTAAIFLLDARSFRDAPIELNLGGGLSVAALTEYVRQLYTPGRTMLGAAQLAQLKSDLLAAQAAGVLWKFVMVPEPVQNLGPLNASDRYEGYAAERADLLRFIAENKLTNVVFVAADIHGTLVNNLTYADSMDAPQQATGAWEISTESAAFDAPFGPTVTAIALRLGLVTPEQKKLYDNLPPGFKDVSLLPILNAQITAYNYDLLGLDGSEIPAKLLSGLWIATQTFGWTEFEIDADGVLLVTTYGIPYYTQAEMSADPASVSARVPAIMQQFSVQPR